MKKGLLIVISGPSGAGKGTVLARVKQIMGNVEFSISATTRKPRPGEVNGVNYFFIDDETFFEMKKKNGFLESQKVYNHYYGTPKSYVEELRSQGIDVILEIDTQGAFQVIKENEDVVSIFMTPPTKQELFERLRKRSTESESDLAVRFKWAHEEYNKIYVYDYVIINDKVEDSARDIKNIILAERLKTKRNADFIEKIKEEK